MKTHTITITDVAAARRAAVRKVQQGKFKILEEKNKAGEVIARFQPVYINHSTSVPPVEYGRNPKYRRAASPWRLRLKEKPATTIINCLLVPVEKAA